MTMNPEIKASWLEALRSGKFKQGDGFLKVTEDYGMGATETRHCCLGVLCDMAADAGVESRMTPYEADHQLSWAFGHNYETEGLTDAVQEWAGIDTNLGELDTPIEGKGRDGNERTFHSVAELNDNGYTFAEIADVIEKQF